MQPTDISSTAVGPGSIDDQGIQPDALLFGASEHEYVTIRNILPVDFIGQVAQERPVNVPFEVRKDGVTTVNTQNENDVSRNYGLNLKNQDHVAKGRIANKVVIPSGKTINLLGNEAQVVVRQMVTEILQRQGKKLMLADAYQRRQIEEQIVENRRPVTDILGNSPQSVVQQNRAAVESLNKEQDEQQFPSVTGEPTKETESGDTSSAGTTVESQNSTVLSPTAPTAAQI